MIDDNPLAVRCPVFLEHLFDESNSLLKCKDNVRFGERGRDDLAVSAPERPFGGDDARAVDVHELVIPSGFRVQGSRSGDLLDDLGVPDDEMWCGVEEEDVRDDLPAKAGMVCARRKLVVSE